MAASLATRFRRLFAPARAETTRAPQGGVFLCHRAEPRIRAHFERLRRETEGLVDWVWADDPGYLDDPPGRLPYPHPAETMPTRWAEARRWGNVALGTLDIVLVPTVLASAYDHVWFMEYDVDFAGDWRRVFRRFRETRSDLVTSTIVPIRRTPDWHHAKRAVAPPDLRPARRLRAFHPLCRLSRRFAEGYRAATATGAWRGHYEFTFPTVARYLGLALRDLNPAPGSGRPPLYANTPGHSRLVPGSFVWRPERTAYFHEAPETFETPGLLYHPVKVEPTNAPRP